MNSKKDGELDIEMERLLTPGPLSRIEQDDVFSDVMRAVSNEAAQQAEAQLEVEAEKRKRFSWMDALPLGFASMCSVVVAALIFVGEPQSDVFTARGQTTLELRCNDEPAVFFTVGVHSWPRCVGKMEVRFSKTPPSYPAIAMVTDDDDLRWIEPLPVQGKYTRMLQEGAFIVAATGKQRILLVRLLAKSSKTAEVTAAWEAQLSSWEAASSPTRMQVVFEEDDSIVRQGAP